MQDAKSIDDLLAIMARLRDPTAGCPWDLKQSFRTILPYTLEEAYEVAEAIEQDDMEDLRDELGDLLLQVVFHSQMASESQTTPSCVCSAGTVPPGETSEIADRVSHVSSGMRRVSNSMPDFCSTSQARSDQLEKRRLPIYRTGRLN